MENTTNPFKITVKGVISIFFRYKALIVIAFIFCIFCTLIGLQFITPLYDANVKMLVKGQNIISSETYTPIMGSVHMTQAEIVKSQAVLKRAVLALDLQDRPFDYERNYCSKLKKYFIDYQFKKTEIDFKELPLQKQQQIKIDTAIENLQSRLKVSMVPGTDIFIINVTAFTPEEAIETANVISRSYTLFDQIQQLAEVRMRYGEFHPTVIQLRDNINEITNNLSGKPLSDIEAIGTASVKIIEQATSTGKRIGKPKRIILAAALFVSIGISFGLSLLLGLFNRTLKTPQDIVEYISIPCIGSIPRKQIKDKYLINDKSPNTKYFSFYEELSEQLLVFLKTQGLKTVAITSPLYNKNHKYIVPNIGYFLSRIMGNKILLIDVNFNHPNFQKIYSLNGSDSIDGNNTLEIEQNFIQKMDEGPDIISSQKNTERFSLILKKINFEMFIKKNKKEYDAIIIDATSVNNMKEISSISDYCDGIVIVIDEGKMKREMLKNSLPRLKRKDTVIIGGILNNRTFPIPGFIYKYFKFSID